MNQTKAESPPVIEVNISQPQAMFGYETVNIVRDGDSAYFHTYNRGQRPEIGFWRHNIPSTMFQDLVARLDGSNYQAIPQNIVMKPGQTLMTIEITRAGDAAPYRESFLPRQPELADVMALVATIKAELRQHPRRVLRGEARWRNESVRKGDTAMLDVTLSNVGSQQLQIQNPAWERTSGISGFRLWVRSEEGVAQGLVDVLAKDVQAIDASAATPQIHLAPGEQASFTVRKGLAAIDPGRCKTALEIRSDLTESATQEFVAGKLAVDMGFVTVTQ